MSTFDPTSLYLSKSPLFLIEIKREFESEQFIFQVNHYYPADIKIFYKKFINIVPFKSFFNRPRYLKIKSVYCLTNSSCDSFIRRLDDKMRVTGGSGKVKLHPNGFLIAF